MRTSESLVLEPVLGTLLSIGLLSPTSIFFLNLIRFYFAIFGYYLLETFSFLLRNGNGFDTEGREGGRKSVIGGGIIIVIFCPNR